MDRIARPGTADHRTERSRLTGIPAAVEIMTLAGPVRADRLFPGMRVMTRETGAATLKRVVQRPAPADRRYVKVRRDALGGKPQADVILPAGQRVLIRDWRAKALWGARNARVEIARLIDDAYVTWTHEAPGDLVELTFDGIATVYGCGLELVTGAVAEARIR